MALDRPYAQVDRLKLKTKLMRAAHESGAEFLSGKVSDVDHEERLSSVTVRGGAERYWARAVLVRPSRSPPPPDRRSEQSQGGALLRWDPSPHRPPPAGRDGPREAPRSVRERLHPGLPGGLRHPRRGGEPPVPARRDALYGLARQRGPGGRSFSSLSFPAWRRPCARSPAGLCGCVACAWVARGGRLELGRGSKTSDSHLTPTPLPRVRSRVRQARRPPGRGGQGAQPLPPVVHLRHALRQDAHLRRGDVPRGAPGPRL